MSPSRAYQCQVISRCIYKVIHQSASSFLINISSAPQKHKRPYNPSSWFGCGFGPCSSPGTSQCLFVSWLLSAGQQEVQCRQLHTLTNCTYLSDCSFPTKLYSMNGKSFTVRSSADVHQTKRHRRMRLGEAEELKQTGSSNLKHKSFP